MAIQAAASVSIPFNSTTGAVLDESVYLKLKSRKTYFQQDLAGHDVADIRGIGPKLGATLKRHGVKTIGDFALMSSSLVPAGFAGVHAALQAIAIG